MLNYLVIGLCLALLIAVIYFSIKPISMGIEARREINEIKIKQTDDNPNEINYSDENSLSDELLKLNDLKLKGILTEEEYKEAKKKLLS
tara:strand:+ start:71 stop:337 length:267 start_codon:yes stop_codon:yes gene_type:complete